MRKTRKWLVSVAAMALVAAPLAAQAGQGQGRHAPRMQQRGMMQGGPAEMIRNPMAVVLDHAEELELTDEQVATLEGLRAGLDEQNGPRWERLRAAFGEADPREMSVEERQALRERMQELGPVRDEVRAANRAAMDQVHELLTDDQESRLHGVMRRVPAGRGQPGAGMRARHPGGGVMGAAYRSGFRDGLARGMRMGRRGPRGGG